MTDSASPSQVEPVGLPDWQQRHLDKLVEALTNWRNEDHEDAVTLARSDVIALLEGLKVVDRAAPSSVRSALEEIGLLVDEYNPAQPDWSFRKGVIKDLLDRAALAHPAPQDEMREAAETVVKVWKDAPSHVSFGRFMEDALSKLDAALAAQAPAPGGHEIGLADIERLVVDYFDHSSFLTKEIGGEWWLFGKEEAEQSLTGLADELLKLIRVGANLSVSADKDGRQGSREPRPEEAQCTASQAMEGRHSPAGNADEKDLAELLCGTDGNGFLEDCSQLMQEAYKIRARAVLERYRLIPASPATEKADVSRCKTCGFIHPADHDCPALATFPHEEKADV